MVRNSVTGGGLLSLDNLITCTEKFGIIWLLINHDNTSCISFSAINKPHASWYPHIRQVKRMMNNASIKVHMQAAGMGTSHTAARGQCSIKKQDGRKSPQRSQTLVGYNSSTTIARQPTIELDLSIMIVSSFNSNFVTKGEIKLGFDYNVCK